MVQLFVLFDVLFLVALALVSYAQESIPMISLYTRLGLSALLTLGMGCSSWGDGAPAEEAARPSFPVPLRLTAVSPAEGALAGDTPVVLTGAGFAKSGDLRVRFGEAAATSVALHGDGVLTAVSPPGAAGAVDVIVTLGEEGAVLRSAFTYVAGEALALSGLQPDEGTLRGGDIVLVRGQGFRAGALVRFGDDFAAGVEVVSSQLLTCISPPGSAGPVEVTLINPDGTSASLPDGFRYVDAQGPRLGLATLTPGTGGTAGGDLLMVTGTGFAPGLLATLGGAPLTLLEVPSSDLFVARSPAGAAGPADLVVTREDGQRATLAAAYTYLSPPAPPASAAPLIAHLSPRLGPLSGGTPVHVRGSGFVAGSTLRFGDVPAETRFVDETHLWALAPARESPALVSLHVDNPDGQRASLGAAFTYHAPVEAPPAATTWAPRMGPALGGTRVLVTGAGFSPTTQVMVGDASGTEVVALDGEHLLFTAPANPAGTATLRIVNEDGQVAEQADAFAYFLPGSVSAPVPTLTSIAPRAGLVGGGERVVISGAGFGVAPLVLFGDRPASLVRELQGGLLEVIAPPGRSGAQPVRVVSAQGMSGVLEGGYVYFEPAPSVALVEPASGPLAGGNEVVLHGANFAEGVEVRVGGMRVDAARREDARRLRLSMPPHAAGLVDLRVTNPSGLFDVAAGGYRYEASAPVEPPTLLALSPASAPAAGGLLAVVSGSGFAAGMQVRFGEALSPEVEVFGPSLLTARIPAGSAGAVVDLRVERGDGLSALLPGAFRYDEAPVEATLRVFSAVPGQGGAAGGTAVTLTGSGFVPGMEVSFGLVPAQAVVFVSEHVLSAVSPAGSGIADVVVRRPDLAQVVLPESFAYLDDSVPLAERVVVDEVSPRVGPAGGGTFVTLAGRGFAPGAEVRFGGVLSPQVTVHSATSLAARAPASVAGTVSLTVENPGGARALFAGAFTFFEPEGLTPPRVVSVTPYQASALGGEAVDVFGSGFQPGVALLLCGQAARIESFAADQLRVLPPGGPLGTCDVVAVNVDGLSGTLSGGLRYVPPTPALTDLLPTTGSPAGGTRVLVRGAGFLPDIRVTFGGVAAPLVEVWDASTLVATTPVGTPATVDVRVVNPGGLDATLPGAFTYEEPAAPPVPPTLSHLVPAQGPVGGGTPVEVHGTGFQPGMTVLLGGRAPAQVEVVSDTVLTLLTAPGTGGSVALTVLNRDGLGASLADAFTYEAPVVAPPRLLGVTPAAGPAAGGVAITVSGEHLQEGAAIYLGAARLRSVAAVGGTLVTGLTPPGAPGRVDLLYVGPDGQSARLEDAYTFVAAPRLASLGPDFGPVAGGAEVVLLGEHFQAGAQVYFGDRPAQSAAVAGPGRINAIAPVASGPGPVDVQVVNPDGQRGGLAGGFRYLVSPQVSAIDPAQGPEAGGTWVRVSGAAFEPGASVYFGQQPAAQVVAFDATTLYAVTPARSPSRADVRVRNPDGQEGALAEAFTFVAAVNLAPAPVVSAVSLLRGPEAGGTRVVLEGANFHAEARVMFGLAEAEVEARSATSLRVLSPPGTGEVTLAALNPDGQQARFPTPFTYLAPATLPAEPLRVSGVSPASGPTAGGTLVELSGTGFSAPLEVWFGDARATEVSVPSATQALARTPAQPASNATLAVVDGLGRSAFQVGAFRYLPPPVLGGLTPLEHAVTGGRSVEVSGQELGQEGALPELWLCSDVRAPAEADRGCDPIDPATVDGAALPASLTFVAPPRAAGLADLRLRNPDGQEAWLEDALAYIPLPTLASLSRTSGTSLGGQSVTVSGSGFRAGVQVSFGAAPCTGVELLSDTALRCTTPAHAAGLVDVRVENPDGGAVQLAGGFTFIAPPTLATLTPNVGPETGGIEVTITGTGFQPGAEVRVGSQILAPGAVQRIGEAVLVFQLPAGTGVVPVTVTNPDGQSATRAQGFTYAPAAPPPTPSYAIPNRGGDSGGTLVQIIGAGFLNGVQVFFGQTGDWTEAVVIGVENSGTLLRVTSPARAAGQVDLLVRNSDGQEGRVAGGFTFQAAPTAQPLSLASVSPARGGVVGGQTVVMSGQGFRSGVQVFVGQDPTWVQASAVEWLGSTMLRATLPAAPGGVAGAVDVRIVNPPVVGPDEIVASGAYTYTIDALLGLPDHTRLPPEPTGDRAAHIADFTGDGLNDVLILRQGQARLAVNTPPRADRKGWFQTRTVTATSTNDNVSASTTGDFDEDGDVDFVYFDQSSLRINFCANSGSGDFSCRRITSSNNNCEPTVLKAADLNCDGHLDLFLGELSTSSGCANKILAGDGKGYFAQLGNRLPNYQERTRDVAFGDVDLDGDVDLLIANDDAMQNRLHYNNCNNNRPAGGCMEPSSYLGSNCTTYTDGDRTYSLCSSNVNWQSARMDCEVRGGELATINSTEERQYIRSIIGSNFVWLNYNDLQTEGQFEWGDPTSTFTDFCSGENGSGGGNEDCGLIRGSNYSTSCLLDAPCTSGYYYICESAAPVCQQSWSYQDASYGGSGNFPVSGGNTRAVALVDVNNDGFVDAVAGNQGQQTAVYMNSGGNFAADLGVRWPQNETSPRVYGLFPADVDRDGDVDMLVRAYNDARSSYQLRVYLNDYEDGGGGVFTNVTETNVSRDHMIGDNSNIAVGDLDSDFLPDVYAVHWTHQDRLFMNNGYAEGSPWGTDDRLGSAMFAPNTIMNVPEEVDTVWATAWGDIDKDGDIDLVKCGNGLHIRVYINNSGVLTRDHQRFDSTRTFWCGVKSLTLADLNGDTWLDLAWTSRNNSSSGNDGAVFIALNDGNGSFLLDVEGTMPGDTVSPYHLVAADVDGDSDLDLIIPNLYWTNYNTSRNTQVLINAGDPLNEGGLYWFSRGSSYFPNQDAVVGGIRPHTYMRRAFIFDVDYDGLPDIYFARDGQNQLERNTGNRSFSNATSVYLPALSDNSYDVVIADFDGDGDEDIYVVNYGQDRFLVREANDKFSDITSSSVPNTAPLQRNGQAAAAGDLNNDGLPDLVIGNWQQPAVMLINRGDNTFVHQSESLPYVADEVATVDMVDIDNDGDLDVYMGTGGQDRLFVNPFCPADPSCP